MSHQKDVLRKIAQVITSNGPYRIEEWFTEDFRFVDPTRPNWPRGYEGAGKLLENFRAFTPPVEFVALDMIEESDRVAVRWQLSGTNNGEPRHLAMIATYRFNEGRIAEDWGFHIQGKWLD